MTDRASTSRIRVGLRIAGGPVPAFIAAAVRAIQDVAGAEVVLVVVARPAAGTRTTRARVLRRMELAYEWLERHALPGGPSAIATERSWRGLPDVPVVHETSDDLRAPWSDATDVLIDLTFDDAMPSAIPPSGYWRLRFTDRPDGPHRTEIRRPAASPGLVGSLLSIDLGHGRTLAAEEGLGALHRFGFARDRDAAYWRSSLLAARRLARLVAGWGDQLEAAAGTDPTEARRSGPVAEPTVPPFAGLVLAVARKALDRALVLSTWVVLTRRRDPGGSPPRDLTGFRPVMPPPGRFYADPFVLHEDGTTRMYVEDCPIGQHRGRISLLRVDADGAWWLDRVVLDDLDHRAYPHVIRSRDGLVMTPDGGRHGGVDLLVAVGSHLAFEPNGRCLEDLAASDPTLLWHDDRYWLFATVTGHGMSPWDELHLFSSASLDGVWHPHPRNPVVADVRRARPAGRIFQLGDTLVRPGQDCSEAYGRRIVLSAITRLTIHDYEEQPIGAIEPVGVPGVVRTHTYSFDGTVEAVDGYRRTPRWKRRQPAGR